VDRHPNITGELQPRRHRGTQPIIFATTDPSCPSVTVPEADLEMRRAQAAPTATVMRFRMLDNCSAVIREAVRLTRRSETLVT
jgi:hypothetical protein